MSEETKGIIYKVGDVVFSSSRYHGWNELNVARVTPTTAILTDGTRLKQGRPAGQSAIGGTGYGGALYYPDTEQTRKIIYRHRNKDYAIHYKLAKFSEQTEPSDDVVAKIVAIHKAAMVQINDILNENEL